MFLLVLYLVYPFVSMLLANENGFIGIKTKKEYADSKATGIVNFDVLDKIPGVRRGRAV